MKQLIDMTIYMTVTATAVLLFKALFRNRISARWQLLVWTLLIVRLFVPKLPENRVSVYNAVPRYTYSQNLTEEARQSETELLPPMLKSEAAARDTAEKSFSAVTAAGAVWYIGAAALGLYFLLAYAVYSHRLGKLPEVKNERIYHILKECAEKVGVKKQIRLISHGRIPHLKGFFKPVIVLPEDCSEDGMHDIFIHELCHMKHGDVLLLWLSAIVLCVNWFNPVIWYSFFVFRRDVEIYCDERTLRHCESKKKYARLLLGTALGKNRFMLGTIALMNGKKEVSQRIRRMAFFRKPTAAGCAAIAVIAVLICAVCLTNGMSDYSMSGDKISEVLSSENGAEPPQMEYADTEKAVFSYLQGVFVYDFQKKGITYAVDVSAFSDGSAETDFEASEDGRTLCMTVGRRENEKTDYYKIDIERGRVRKVSKNPIQTPFGGLVPTPAEVAEIQSIASEECAKNGSILCCVSADIYRYPYSLRLFTVDMNSGDMCGYFPLGGEVRSAVLAAPGDIRNLTEAELVFYGESIKINDAESLRVVEQQLGRGRTVKGGADCPFAALLRLTAADGKEWAVYPAADSCATFIGKGGYYSFGGGNSVLYGVFGIDSDYIISTGNNAAREQTNKKITEAIPSGAKIIPNSGVNWTIAADDGYFGSDFERKAAAELGADFKLKEYMKKAAITPKNLGSGLFDVYIYAIEDSSGNNNPYIFIFEKDSGRLAAAQNLKSHENESAVIRILNMMSGNGQSALYEKTHSYIEKEFERVYSPYYEILSLDISDWREGDDENEAKFFLEMRHKNLSKDPDSADYIKELKENGAENYERMKREYLGIKSVYFQLMVREAEDGLQMYFNESPKREDWVAVKADDFIGGDGS